jgi:hypothetical protein
MQEIARGKREIARGKREKQDLADEPAARGRERWETFATKTPSASGISCPQLPNYCQTHSAPRLRKSATPIDVHTAPPPVHLANPQRPAGNQNLPTYDAYDERSRSGPIGRLVEWRYGA